MSYFNGERIDEPNELDYKLQKEDPKSLYEFMEEAVNHSPLHAMQAAKDLLDLEMIERKLNLYWGIELDIKVKPAEKKGGRFYGKGITDLIK